MKNKVVAPITPELKPVVPAQVEKLEEKAEEIKEEIIKTEEIFDKKPTTALDEKLDKLYAKLEKVEISIDKILNSSAKEETPAEQVQPVDEKPKEDVTVIEKPVIEEKPRRRYYGVI